MSILLCTVMQNSLTNLKTPWWHFDLEVFCCFCFWDIIFSCLINGIQCTDLEFLSKHLRRWKAIASDCSNSEQSGEGQIDKLDASDKTYGFELMDKSWVGTFRAHKGRSNWQAMEKNKLKKETGEQKVLGWWIRVWMPTCSDRRTLGETLRERDVLERIIINTNIFPKKQLAPVQHISQHLKSTQDAQVRG